jgi:protein-L-isoaspartate(D-aspartate) O-methyltransferase
MLVSNKSGPTAQDYSAKHGRMMLEIENAGVNDQLVLDAMRAVPPYEFISVEYRMEPYNSRSIPPGPVLLAKMIELLGLKGGETLLQVNTGNGYASAILSRIAQQVYSIEIMPNLAREASNHLLNLGYTNVKVKCGDPVAGWEGLAPFDAIAVTSPVSEVPKALVSQLREGGRMVVLVDSGSGESILAVVSKREGKVEVENVPCAASGRE